VSCKSDYMSQKKKTLGLVKEYPPPSKSIRFSSLLWDDDSHFFPASGKRKKYTFFWRASLYLVLWTFMMNSKPSLVATKKVLMLINWGRTHESTKQESLTPRNRYQQLESDYISEKYENVTNTQTHTLLRTGIPVYLAISMLNNKSPNLSNGLPPPHKSDPPFQTQETDNAE